MRYEFETTKMVSKKAIHASAVVVLAFVGILIDCHLSKETVRRALSHDFGGGDCEWTGAEKIDLAKNPYGTLFASYPGAGMRLTWQMTEGASGIQVGKLENTIVKIKC